MTTPTPSKPSPTPTDPAAPARSTQAGIGVPACTIDHHPDGTAYQRVNKRVALWIQTHVGTMTCAYLFGLLGCVAMYGAFTANVTLTLIAGSISGYFLQLVLLPALMVGQNLQTDASDARATKTFEDTERIIDLLDAHTVGGLKEVLDAVHTQYDRLDRIEHHLQITTTREGGAP